MKSLYRVLMLLLLLLTAGAMTAAPAAAQDNVPRLPGGVTLNAVGGFDGFYKGNFWVPVVVEVTNDGPSIEGALRIYVDRSGNDPGVYFEEPVSLPTQSAKRVTLYVYPRGFTASLDVLLVDANGDELGRVATNALRSVDQDTLLYGVVSDQPGELGYLEDVPGERRSAEVAFLTPAQLPDAVAGWYALDVLVLSNVDTGRFTPEQLTALTVWLETGGTLVLTGGSGWQQTIAAIPESWLPVTPTGTTTVDDLPGLRTVSSVPFRDAGPYLLTSSTIAAGDVVLSDGTVPLLARRDVGRGSVYFMALDPTTAPLLDWDGAAAVWSRIVNNTPQLPFYASGVKQYWTAERAAEGLTPFSLPSIWWMLLFLATYVVIVGPLNYFLLRRMRRTELAWLSIPALIIVFTVGVYLLGLGGRGRTVTVNQMTVAYGQVEGDYVRRQTLLGVYSPQRTTYDVTLPADSLARPLTDEFSFDVGSRLSGIQRGNATVLRDVRVDVSGTEKFLADSHGPVPAIEGQVILRFADEKFRLDVLVRNNSDVFLENANLLFGSLVRPIGNLAPGASFQDTIVLSEQLASAAASAFSGSPAFVPRSGGTSPLMSAEAVIVGSSGSLDETREIRARADFLESLHFNYGSSDNVIPRATATLVAWSDEAPLAVDTGRRQDTFAQTLYFLELPFSQTVASGRNVTIGAPFWTYDVRDADNVYNTSPTELYLTNGSITYEFEPWPEFQAIAPTELQLQLDGSNPSGSARLILELWDWEREVWVELDANAFGTLDIIPAAPFLGPDNQVRLRLSNRDFNELTIRNVYPILTGDLE